MQKMTVLIFVNVAAIAFFFTISRSDAKNRAREALELANFAGVCVIKEDQEHFQTSKGVTGGNEFLDRYWTFVVNRVGADTAAYSANCKRSIKLYQGMLDKTPK